MASTEPPQEQQKWLRNLVPWGRPFEMLFLLFTVYRAGGNIEEEGFHPRSKSLSTERGLRLRFAWSSCCELFSPGLTFHPASPPWN